MRKATNVLAWRPRACTKRRLPLNRMNQLNFQIPTTVMLESCSSSHRTTTVLITHQALCSSTLTTRARSNCRVKTSASTTTVVDALLPWEPHRPLFHFVTLCIKDARLNTKREGAQTGSRRTCVGKRWRREPQDTVSSTLGVAYERLDAGPIGIG